MIHEPFMTRKEKETTEKVQDKPTEADSSRISRITGKDEDLSSAQKQPEKVPENAPGDKEYVLHDEKKDAQMAKENASDPLRASDNIVNSELFGVLSADIAYQLEQDADEEKELFERLEEHRRKGDVLWGTVSAVEMNSNSTQVLFTVIWDTVRVVIPASVYFEKTWNFGTGYETLSKDEKIARHIVAGRETMGANCPFIIKAVTRNVIESGRYEGDSEIIAVGSRTEALEVLRDIYFYHKNTAHPVDVRVNDQANANIIYVSEELITVECLGVETRIDCYNLNEAYVDNCKNYVKPGQIMRVRIKKIDIRPDHVYLAVTGRLNLGSKKISSIKINGSYLGYVESYNRQKGIYTCKIYPDVCLKHGKFVSRDEGVNVSVHKNAVNGHEELNVGDSVHIKVKDILGSFAVGIATKV